MKGHWEMSDSNGVVLAQGEVGAAPTPGDYAFFMIDLATLGLSPSLYVRIQGLTDKGYAVGGISPPVLLKPYVSSGDVTCFTDGGLLTSHRRQARNDSRRARSAGARRRGGHQVRDGSLRRRRHSKNHGESHQRDEIRQVAFWFRHQGHDIDAGRHSSTVLSVDRWLEHDCRRRLSRVGKTMNATIAQTTLRQLLAHRSGLYLFSAIKAPSCGRPISRSRSSAGTSPTPSCSIRT